MFNTSKINERPEYASSPSTMSDPIEWRPNNQLEILEERLMRIHQWNDSAAFLNRPYEGHGVTISDLNQSVDNGYENDFENNASLPESPSRDQTFGFNDCQKRDGCDQEYETHSELSGQSERLIEDVDVDVDADCNHKEYDVEEYVEQINQYVEGSENSSNECLSNSNSKTSHVAAIKMRSLDSESFERQKHMEKLFNLDVKENDNEFISELKIVLVEKLKTYFLQKSDKIKCSLTDDIRKVAEILNRAITDKDSVICDKVHELCLRLRDILVLKDEILNNSLPDEAKSELGLRTSFNSEVCETSTPDFDTTCENPSTEIAEYDSVGKTHRGELKEKLSNEKITMIHTYKENEQKPDSPNAFQKESFESLIKFSRIPVAKNKHTRIANSTVRNQVNGQPKTGQKVNNAATKIPAPAAGVRLLLNNDKDNHGHINKRTGPRYSKDILQQKEEIMRKAALFGLDGIEDIQKVPHLTERGQLALLEKQIQGKIKSKQLAMERKKVGLRDRVSNFKLSSDSSDTITKHVTKAVKASAVSQQVNTVTIESYQQAIPSSQSYVKEMKSSGTEESAVRKTPERMLEEEEYDERVASASSAAASEDELEPEQQLENTYPTDDTFNVTSCVNTHQCFMPTRLSQIVNADVLGEGNIVHLTTDEDKIDCAEIKQDLILKETAVLDTLIPEEKHKSLEQTFEHVGTSRTTERSNFQRRSLALYVVIPAIAILLSLAAYFYKTQIFEFHGHYSVVFKQLWVNIINYNFKGKITEHFGEVRKYMKRKCELL